ncbi:MAG: hypothetical protein EHM47_05785 [Ignavibacteriales bacterium]|nr:MAG: hypothetical protein EHM47_05785 [Ignavibacteriales bacterium]
MNNGRTFPRKLTSLESMLLFSVLPEKKPGYRSYRNKIDSLVVIGSGRFGGGNFILGKENAKPDLSFPSTSVFASGTNIYEEAKFDIIIHEELDDEIEYDISSQEKIVEADPASLTEVKKWNYSEWNPGDKAPGDNSYVREVLITEDKYILAIAPFHKKIWLHEYGSGVNYLIPVSNFYNELMRVCSIKDTKVALNPSSFFETLNNYKDEELMVTFFSYNRYIKRINIEETIPVNPIVQKKKNLFSIFRKG